MVMNYPWVPIAGAAVLVVGFILIRFFPFGKGTPFHGGIRAANTYLTKELPYYRKLVFRKKVLTVILFASLTVSVMAASFLAARPYRVQKVTNGIQRRDIFLCLDVSYSLYALNYGLADYLENIVKELEGDRFGILMFNTSPVVYVPMTDDYDYVVQRLEELKEYFELQKEFEERFEQYNYTYEMSDEEYADYIDITQKLRYFEAGTLVNNMTRGSSLIGEGLASCLYSFPSIGDSERTRAIILATDNADSALGQETPRLPEACSLCQKNGVTVFAIFPDERNYYQDYTVEEYKGYLSELTQCVKKTGGDTYVESADQTVGRIVESIRRHKAMTVDEIVTEKPVDVPALPYIVLFTSIFCAGCALLILRL